MTKETLLKKALDAQNQFGFAEEEYQKAKYTHNADEKNERVAYWYKKISTYQDKLSLLLTNKEYLNYLTECQKIDDLFQSRKN